jgi:hypothetical protein
MVRCCTLVVVLLCFGFLGAARADPGHWEAAADLGGVHTLGSDSLFQWAVTGGGSLTRRLRGWMGVGVFADYRRIVDPAPASSFWYADIGARSRFIFTERLWLSLDVGWGFRHIGLSNGYSNTAGGAMAACALGVILFARPSWNIGAAATYHFTWRFQAELFATQDTGLSVVWMRLW